MADYKLAYGSPIALATATANIATSATAGWQSAIQDNTSDKMIEVLVEADLAAVNTAPANNKAIYLFAFGLVDASGNVLTSTGDAVTGTSEATLTFPNIGTQAIVAPQMGIIPYPIQNKRLIGGPFSLARCFGGVIPPKWAVGMINYSGMTLSVNFIKATPIYATVT